MQVNEKSCSNASPNGSWNWNAIYWITGALFMPIVFPLFAFNFWNRMRIQYLRGHLTGKVVLITGASSGLGEALAHVFYKSGCKVILAARRMNELERVKKDLLEMKMTGVTYPPTIISLDLSHLNSIPEFAKKCLTLHNRIDILINNGGIGVRSNALSSAIDVDVKVMVVNYLGAVALTKAIVPAMIKVGGGNVVFISSVQGKFALPFRSSYSASKHALQAFADSLRAEVEDKNVYVTCISPGYIRTQLSVNALTSNGTNHGKMDEATAAGMLPEKMANEVLLAVVRKDKDVIVCDLQARIAIYLRFFCPSIYFWIMKKRAIKLLKCEALDSGGST